MKCPECGQDGSHEFTCSRFQHPPSDFTIRKCPECACPITAHDWRCSRLKSKRYSKRDQDKHRQLATPYHAGHLDTGEMSDLEWHFADRDDFNFLEEGL